MFRLFLAATLSLAGVASAQTHGEVAQIVVDQHILPGFAAFDQAATPLAEASCAEMRPVYDAAFDGWMGVSHLRFGPTELDERGFALAFWPDTRGATPATLRALIADEDPIIASEYSDVSIAARGFFALDWLLFDTDAPVMEPGTYPCALAEAIARDIANIAEALHFTWQKEAVLLTTAGAEENFFYLDDEEVVRTLFSAVLVGLEITIEKRLGRPLGTFERPRPRRAEAWRSARSLPNIVGSMTALRDLANPFLAFIPEEEADRINAAWDATLRTANNTADPTLAIVATPEGRVHVEAIQSQLTGVHDMLETIVGPALGVSQSFNALDGD
ncbi:imelysin family protein [Pontivivens insulae]|uniref:Iron-regulated protein A n=1 Tax=Pontivivens insulae TaxID=1639689 RepID=A0A2R8A9F5_9RHOB|nr:imelysin family protein [Pontivivens insulae]RED18770.1 hypothetical protein DFR53_0970 [Pontivivens insulae]SPF28668.1 Iron-regulated protein A [Pontivivens insulae]